MPNKCMCSKRTSPGNDNDNARAYLCFLTLGIPFLRLIGPILSPFSAKWIAPHLFIGYLLTQLSNNPCIKKPLSLKIMCKLLSTERIAYGKAWWSSRQTMLHNLTMAKKLKILLMYMLAAQHKMQLMPLLLGIFHEGEYLRIFIISFSRGSIFC
jgi:hypothetical protein